MKKSSNSILSFVWLLTILCSFLSGLIAAGFLVISEITQSSVAFGNWAMWSSAFGTVGTLAFLSWQHIQQQKLIDDRDRRDKRVASSQEALDAYIRAVDSLIGYLTNDRLSKDRKFSFLEPTYKSLLALQPKVTEKNHQAQATAKYSELHVHLSLFYFDLKAEDFFTMDRKEGNDIPFSAHGRNWQSSVYALLVIWLKYVVPKYGTLENRNFTMYGWRQQMIDDDCIFYLLSLLLSHDLKMVNVESIEGCFRELTNIRNKCRLRIDDLWFREAIEDYPLLLAHLLLRSSLTQAIKVSENPEIFYPKLITYGSEDAWFVIDFLGAPASKVLSIPNLFSNSRYTTRLHDDNKIPNAGSFRTRY